MVILTLTQLTRLAITRGADHSVQLLGGGYVGQGAFLWSAGCMESEASPLHLPSHPQSLLPCWELGLLRRCWAWLVLT